MNRIPMRDLARTRRAFSRSLHEGVAEVLARGIYIGGSETHNFEGALARFVESSQAVGVSSGTAALQLSLMAAQNRKPGDVVSVPNAGSYAAIAATRCGFSVRLCDVDPGSHLMSPDELFDVMDRSVSAVVVTHLYGNVVDLAALQSIADSCDAVLVEDAAQAFGGHSGGRHVGSMGWMAAHSFFPTKNLGGVADGGAITTSSDEAAELVRALRTYGWGEQYLIEFAGGSNYRMSELDARVLLEELEFVQSDIESRLAITQRYAEAIADSPVKMVTSASDGNTAHLCVLEFPTESMRNQCREHLATLSIDSAVHYPRSDFEQVGLALSERTGDAPVARELTRRVLSVPCFPEMTEAECLRVEGALRQFGSMN